MDWLGGLEPTKHRSVKDPAAAANINRLAGVGDDRKRCRSRRDANSFGFDFGFDNAIPFRKVHGIPKCLSCLECVSLSFVLTAPNIARLSDYLTA